MKYDIPKTQNAVQLVGPDKLAFNADKEVFSPGAYQILGKVEAVGLCFSDLKLLKQFSGHARKSDIINGIDPSILSEIPSYVPNDKPTIPGHETVVRICAMGNKVKGVKLNGRYLVQTDYRWLTTANSNAAFGYNFEGALQEYVLMDQRVITSPEGESMLIEASENLSASAIALAEPWACVEDAYAVVERTTLKTDGRMLVVADTTVDTEKFRDFLKAFGKPANINYQNSAEMREDSTDALYDDIIYFGSNPETIEALFAKLAVHALLNIVLCDNKLSRNVVTPVGRVHYGGIRIIGTTGSDPADAMKYIPPTGEIRPGNKIDVIGAGGPMGLMHVVRNICQGVKGVTVLAGDLDRKRLDALDKIAAGLAEKNKVRYMSYNPASDGPNSQIDYIVMMVPVPKLVAASIGNAAAGAIINIFAGIPATVSAELDLQTYIEKKLYFIGTSGSTLQDLRTILKKVESGRLDTNISVAAVASLDGAVEGIRAVENQSVPGKIIIYPACKGLGLTTLDKLLQESPQVANALTDGLWTKNAEEALLNLKGKK
jgi:D-arabinose 1-dehydrogenase-like Zn-dependent alcohol dehydrogenase